MLTRTKIRNLTHAAFYARGLDLYLSDKVKELQMRKESFVDMVDARVEGSGTKEYHVRICYDDVRDELVREECDCPAFYSYEGLCKHIVAVLLKYLDRKELEKRKPEENESGGHETSEGSYRDRYLSEGVSLSAGEGGFVPGKRRMLQMTTPVMKQLLNRQVIRKTAPLVQGGVYGKVRIEPFLTCERTGVKAEFRIGATQMYVLKDVLDFADWMDRGEEHEYGKKLSFMHLMDAFEPESRGLAAFIRSWGRENGDKYIQNNYYGYHYGNLRPKIREMSLSDSDLEAFLESVGTKQIRAVVYKRNRGTKKERTGGEGFRKNYYENGDSEDDSDGEIFWQVKEGEPARRLRILGGDEGIWLEVSCPVRYQGRHRDIYFENGNIYLSPREQLDPVRDFQMCAEQAGNGKIFIQKEDVPAFCRDFLPDLEKYYECEKVNFNIRDYDVNPVSFEIYLDAPQRDLITCRVMAVYGDRKYNVYGDREDAGQRDLAREIVVGQAVAAYCNAYDPVQMTMAIADTEDQIYEILTEGISRMQELGEVFVSDALKKIRVAPNPHVTVGISLSGDLLELSMSSEDMTKEELIEILSRYDRRKKYYRLKNGDFIKVEGEGLETLSVLKNELGLSEKQLGQKQIALPKYRALFLDGELKGDQALATVKNKAFRALIRNMRTVEDNDFEVPELLEGVLREYQKRGFLWLKTLRYNGFGGILADDMGLGKTLQILAFLYSEFMDAGAEDNRRCLIVTPASLVYNWYNEVQRFTPLLPVKMIVGTLSQRQQMIEQAGKREVLITSYDLLKRDIEAYQGKKFFCQVIDEAQFIKNHNTQSARAVKEIEAECKLALTGTPVENRLSELWSIFDYLMPGFLFSYQRFREKFESPIVQQQDKAAMEQLQKMIRPFVLRRLKKDVLKDLPDKMEEEVYAVLQGEQQKLYDAHVKRIALMLDKQTEEEFRTSKIQILSELTRLRQLCCDPMLLYENFPEESAKKELCLNMVRSAVGGGHKILLFSQFTSMLDILCRQLEDEGITYYTLTGSTSKEKRKELVEKFQQDDTNVFCISLKAGGTGLNLTAADIVIHYDPWWNLAVQNQATDRAHRIGQENTVTVYKLITKGTIEENILHLQEKKRQLADQVLSGEEIGSGSFTKEELMEILGMNRAERE